MRSRHGLRLIVNGTGAGKDPGRCPQAAPGGIDTENWRLTRSLGPRQSPRVGCMGGNLEATADLAPLAREVNCPLAPPGHFLQVGVRVYRKGMPRDLQHCNIPTRVAEGGIEISLHN